MNSAPGVFVVVCLAAALSAVSARPGHVQLPPLPVGGDVVQGQGQHEKRRGKQAFLIMSVMSCKDVDSMKNVEVSRRSCCS